MTWTCYARPAALGGRTCFHQNDKGIKGIGPGGKTLICCEGCGATKLASDDRLKRGDVDKRVQP